MKVLTVFGTRPEAIKMCPLVLELRKHSNIECIVCLTGQHREMLRQVMDSFGIVEDYNLDIMKNRQTLTTITTSVLKKLEPILIKVKPDVVLGLSIITHTNVTAIVSIAVLDMVNNVKALTAPRINSSSTDFFQLN